MTRIIIAIFLLVAIISLGVIELVFINNSFTTIIKKCDEIHTLLINKEYDTALTKTNDSIEWWRKKRDIIELTSPHNETKEFITKLSELYGSIVAKNYQDAITLSISLQEDALTRLNILSFKLKNIF